MSPEFGLNGEMNGSRGSGSNGSGKGAGSTLNRGRVGNRTRSGGTSGNDDGDDDDDNNDGNGGNRGNQPLELAKSAHAFFPNAVRENTPPRSKRSIGGGGGSGGNDPDDPFGSPNGRDNNYNNRSPPRPFPERPGGDGDGGGGDNPGGGDPGREPDRAWNGYVQEYRLN
eukprot:509682-Amphidinium_carterae.1